MTAVATCVQLQAVVDQVEASLDRLDSQLAIAGLDRRPDLSKSARESKHDGEHRRSDGLGAYLYDGRFAQSVGANKKQETSIPRQRPPKSIEPFEGKIEDDARRWLRRSEAVLESYCISKKRWPVILGTSFEKGASSWYDNLVVESSGPLDWIKFKSEFLEYPCLTENWFEVRRKMDELEFTDMDSYLSSFLALKAQAGRAQFHETEFMYQFQRELPREAQYEVMKDSPKTFQELIRRARTWELHNRWYFTDTPVFLSRNIDRVADGNSTCDKKNRAAKSPSARKKAGKKAKPRT
ncbi:uncharacterized protein PSFLO_00364 [Pseudozyma flocculosa]|uniref:Retrotransposon gag domain-containing protein n=1 Tax=Pseudozyma flocculosa TaxID=84751 RepID=A0A5C3ERE6_9BASI|nr:uncharacterized protein PSFLO_00364 [Pseudozyma flocculosa]